MTTMKHQNKEMNTTLHYYEKEADYLIERYENAEIAILQQKLNTEFKGKTNLLEIGSGSGRDAAFLHKNGFTVTALDGSRNMVRKAQNQYPEIQFIHHVLPSALPFKDQSFGGVYAIAILMHINRDSLNKTLIEIHRVLKKGAVFLLSVPLERDDINSHGMDDKGRFFLSLSKEKWVTILQNVNFTIKNTELSADGLKRSGIIWLNITCFKS